METGGDNQQQWREQPEFPSRPNTPLPNKLAMKSTPMITLLCRFNNGTPESLHRDMRKRYTENLAYIQSLTGMEPNPPGQRPFVELPQHRNSSSSAKTLTTTHMRSGAQLEIYPAKLTYAGADRVFALRGYLRITVRQYYFIRHRLPLLHPKLPLVCVLGGNGHIYHYPLECLQLLEWESADDAAPENNP